MENDDNDDVVEGKDKKKGSQARRSTPEGFIKKSRKRAAVIIPLTIDPERLSQIRNERRPGSTYAALENCRYEVKEAESMMRRSGVSWLSSTHKSIEEIATTILRDIRPDRLIY